MAAAKKPATLTLVVTKPLQFCDSVEFTNRWGQENQRAEVMWHDGDTVSIDYHNCQHEIPVTAITAVL